MHQIGVYRKILFVAAYSTVRYGSDVCEDVLGQEADFDQTIALIELSTQEIEVEVQDSLEEV